MAAQRCGGREVDPRKLSASELNATIAELELERETLEARCRVMRRRVALLRAERLARARNAHFEPGPVADVVETAAARAERSP